MDRKKETMISLMMMTSFRFLPNRVTSFSLLSVFLVVSLFLEYFSLFLEIFSLTHPFFFLFFSLASVCETRNGSQPRSSSSLVHHFVFNLILVPFNSILFLFLPSIPLLLDFFISFLSFLLLAFFYYFQTEEERVILFLWLSQSLSPSASSPSPSYVPGRNVGGGERRRNRRWRSFG